MGKEINMASSKLFLFFYFSFIQLLFPTMSQPDPLFHLCGGGNFTGNSTYKSNLDRLLSSLNSDTTINYGFYNGSVGENADKVNAIALCRGDIKPAICRSCINNSSKKLTQSCPSQKEAITWYDDCMLRYSNRSIFGNMEIEPNGIMYNVNNVSQVNQFNQELRNLINSLTSRAASGDSLRKFATGNAISTNNQTIYALTQCTPDLSEQECSDCLTDATGFLPKCCDGKQGARVLTPSCHFRYEIELFYDPVAETPSPAPATSHPTPPPPLPALPPPSPQAPPPTGTTCRTGKASKIVGAFITSAFLVLL